jgi:hypothetical protein
MPFVHRSGGSPLTGRRSTQWGKPTGRGRFLVGGGFTRRESRPSAFRALSGHTSAVVSTRRSAVPNRFIWDISPCRAPIYLGRSLQGTHRRVWCVSSVGSTLIVPAIGVLGASPGCSSTSRLRAHLRGHREEGSRLIFTEEVGND